VRGIDENTYRSGRRYELLALPVEEGLYIRKEDELRGYELMYILDPTLDEDKTQALIGQIEEFMAKQGVTVEKTEPWGKRRLAYQIANHWEGFYVLSHFQAGTGVVSEVERRLRVTDGVMRFITVRIDEEQEKLERKRAKKGIPAPSQPAPTEAPEAAAPESGEGEIRKPEEEPAGPEEASAGKDVPGDEAPAEAEPSPEDKKEEAEPAGETS
jgi:small subunit ribosomal protein S6